MHLHLLKKDVELQQLNQVHQMQEELQRVGIDIPTLSAAPSTVIPSVASTFWPSISKRISLIVITFFC